MSLPVLTATEQRVLGSLWEKQRTVPASYPLSLNALRLACNQTSSREPVMELSEQDLYDTIRALKDRGLLRLVWAGAGSRVVKYHQLLDELLSAAEDEQALLTTLLLRGAQSPGELKTRTVRLHRFADRAEVEACLTRMAGREPPLVRELPLQRGRQDHRWTHLFGPVRPESEPVGEDESREAVLADGAEARDAKVLAAYEAVAGAYAEQFGDELIDKPFDVWLLERIVQLNDGPIMDLGCGPGQIAAFLADTGAEVHGLDASAAMIEQARAACPDLDFLVGRFDQLLRPRNASAWGTILAWYSFVHLAPSELAPTIRSVAATLRPGGLLVLALHAGSEVTHLEEFLGAAVDLDRVLHTRGEVLAAVAAAGLDVAEWYERAPVQREGQTARLYVLARRPG